MNYYPYMNVIPYATSTPKVGLLKSIFGNINLGSILNGTQKTLNIVNQAIPLIKQAGPMVNNAKTMFRVMNEFKKTDTFDKPINNTKKKESIVTVNNSGNPVFFQ